MATPPDLFDAADQSKPGHYGPAHTALLLLDFHALFVEQLPAGRGAAALAVAADMRAWARARGIPVVHALVDTALAPFATCKDATRFAGIVEGMKAAGGGGEEPAELHSGGDGEGEATFTRRPGYVSALKSPGLLEYLRGRGITSLVLAGLSTSGCVMRTAITAADEEFVTCVLTDACADATEEMHDLMVGKVLTSRGYVATAAEFKEGYDKAMGAK